MLGIVERGAGSKAASASTEFVLSVPFQPSMHNCRAYLYLPK